MTLEEFKELTGEHAVDVFGEDAEEMLCECRCDCPNYALKDCLYCEECGGTKYKLQKVDND